ncbi:nitrite reductase small subunit NirD [Paenibacillus cremeus]|uniref:Nitrite reductase small subunit NirD n=1 Tax=Paenibacillus cremeus TaxID=2163881 RepID=A0A559KHX7_9BACL|nr:nitrite reductase small subunit NirD [Paenibacillus cremeus]TVY11726.1 nitrite reductase small subunit NirD [Paenibacillus cremeus]
MSRYIIGHYSEIEERRARVVQIGTKEIAIFKMTGGELRAIENLCPHKNGKLSEGIVCDHHVFCPLHDWKINLDNGLVEAPDEGCVNAYEVSIDEATGNIVLIVEGSESTKAS